MRDPIIVTGPARSGTSMLTGCLQRCGLQLGDTCGPTSANPRGQYENRELIEKIEKPYLGRIGADPTGQGRLPDPEDLIPDPARRAAVTQIVEAQSVDVTKPWGFKDAKAILDHETWDAAFPDAIWVVTKRDLDDVVSSCRRTRFMRKRADREAWFAWAEYHEYRIADLVNHAGERVYRVDTDRLARGDVDELHVVANALGLQYDDRDVRSFVDPSLFTAGR